MVDAVVAAGASSAASAVNLVALVAFGAAVCWRVEQIRRKGGGLQALAMTVSVSALTLAIAVSNASIAVDLDSWLFAGAARVALYGLLAIGVAGLIIVFFYPHKSVTRERRAGVEAVPLVAALVGLQVSLYLVPSEMRDAPMSQWTLTNWGYAAFYLIATGYLAYGFSACVRSVGRYLALADGYLRRSLIMLITGLGLLAAGSVVQIVVVLGYASGVLDAPWLLIVDRVLAVAGVVAFLLGISYPMVQARWHDLASRRRRRREARELQPLWALVTDAVPEVVLPRTGKLGPTALMHRRVVEIRDALTQLSPFLSPAFEHADIEVQARMIVAAARARTLEGPRRGVVRSLVPVTTDTLEADAAPLLAIAAALAAQADEMATEEDHSEEDRAEDHSEEDHSEEDSGEASHPVGRGDA